MDTYLLYLRTYAKVASGTRLTDADFIDDEARELDPIAQAAVTLAAHDVMRGLPIRADCELMEETQQILKGAASTS